MRISISWNEVRHATISSSAVAALRRSSATGGERIATRRACFKKDKEVHELPPGAGAVEWLSPGSPHYSLLKQGSCWSGALLVANLVVQPPPLAKCHTLWSEVNPPVAVWDSLMCSASVGGRIGTHPASRNSHTRTPLACIVAPTSRTHPSILLGIWGLWMMRPSREGGRKIQARGLWQRAEKGVERRVWVWSVWAAHPGVTQGHRTNSSLRIASYRSWSLVSCGGRCHNWNPPREPNCNISARHLLTG